MPSRRAFLPTLACLAAGFAPAAQAGPAIWVSGEVPPYLWRGAKGPEGYAYELFLRVTRQAEQGAELQFYPWARALLMLQNGQAQAALVITRTPERENQFRWLFPVGNFRFAIATRAADGPVSGDIAALQQKRVGSMRASVSRTMLAGAGVAHVVEGKDYAELLALLQRGLVDAVVARESVVRSVDARVGGEPVRSTLLNQSHELFAAAGSTMSDDAVQRLRQAYQRLVDSGFVAQLKKRHPDVFFDD